MDEIMAITRKIDSLERDRKAAIEKMNFKLSEELRLARKENRRLREMNTSLKSTVSELQQKLKQNGL